MTIPKRNPMAGRADSLFTNPVAAGFLAVELRARADDVAAEAAGESGPSPLAGPRLALLRQAAHELEQTATPDPA